jgi:hypothetical protein
MKKCSRCPNEITSNYTHNGSYCRPCRAKYQADYAKKTKYKQDKKSKANLRKLVLTLKKRPCKDCSHEYPWYVMDFDHARGEKLFNLSEASARGFSKRRVLEEAVKCDVVCSNCHRERTFRRSGLA